ncbi:MAG: TIGR00730 family Rossman fold protein [Acidobacteria bacterium]|nr:TIGR00730 family Rossman fold protein [Acidobacteriota bacterium]
MANQTHDSPKNPFEWAPSCKPVAYKNLPFLESKTGRSVRILSEYLMPLQHLRNERVHDTVVFFGSARIGEEGPMARYYNEARELAKLVTQWSMGLENTKRRFVVTTGGGPGIMAAANRGAYEAGGKSVGLNIGLPFEQHPNPYISPELCFEFHYFFMRKFWFAYLAKALVVFPGGFGTIDELSELLTLMQTRKLEKKMVIVLYGTQFWNEVLDFDALAKHGMISPEDLQLFQWADTPEAAMTILRDGLTKHYLQPKAPQTPGEEETPAISRSRV